MKKLIKITQLCIWGGLILNIPLSSYATCEGRAITNNSSDSWTISFDNEDKNLMPPGDGPFYGDGNVYFTNAKSCSEAKNGPCVINAGDPALMIDYTTHARLSQGIIKLHSIKGDLEYKYTNYISRYDISECPKVYFYQGDSDLAKSISFDDGSIKFSNP